ncbi:hypothetical protein [Duganella aceris]|uniref:Uncharacterized protein n=1 Tax=Duganella aceris TaxID=2703883 RepID=A0ABX0FQH4_9BURK|nr:hypothetical protein [Duganella aceris]NGZ86891.1 hypothetical protein [Duganella aceris]
MTDHLTSSPRRIACALMIAAALAACSRAPSETPSGAGKTPATPVAASAETPAAAAPASTAPTLSTQGYGKLHFGDTLAATETALGEKAQQLGENDPACSSVRFKSLPGARFMVEKGVITRADADTGTPNDTGIAVGDTLAQARQKAPSLQVSPHKYLPEGHYLSVRGAQPNAAFVIEEDGKAVTKIRAGLEPSVNYVEVCL